MIDIGEKFPDVAFENPAIFGVIFTHFIGKIAKSVNRFMRSFIQSARI